jgi:hypothetical protein
MRTLALASVLMLSAAPDDCIPRGGLPNTFAKIKDGAEVRVGYIGGSITAQPGWRVKSLEWFRAKYPKTTFTEINATIGGTGSTLGVYRIRRDMLEKKPDLLFVEFAVNDNHDNPEQIVRAMEGMVRQTWAVNPATDIVFVYTTCLEMLPLGKEGKLPRSAEMMEKVAEHYGIPSINFGAEVAKLETAGKLVYTAPKPKTDAEKQALGDKILFSPDGVHPYPDSGHGVYHEVFQRGMASIGDASAVNPSTPLRAGPHALPAPLAADNWEKAAMLPLSKVTMTKGWEPVPDKDKAWVLMRMPELWRASKPGEGISFKFKGTALSIYDLLGPDCGQILVSVDGKPAETVSKFDQYSSYHRLGTTSVAGKLPDGVHTVKIELSAERPDKEKILAKGGHKIDDPKKYEGAVWYAGGILLVGELVGD